MGHQFPETLRQGQFSDRLAGPDVNLNNAWDTYPNDSRGLGQTDARYRGYVLAKAESRNGDTPSWSRASKQPLPGSDEKLAAMSKKHRLETRRGPMAHFAELSSKQQALINRLRGMIQQSEWDAQAEWVLECVKRSIVRKSIFSQKGETRKLVVIFKKQDRQLTRPTQRLPSADLGQIPLRDIIDINEPADVDGLDFGYGPGRDVHHEGQRHVFDDPLRHDVYHNHRDVSYDQNRQFVQEPLHHNDHQQQYHDPIQGAMQGHDDQFDQPYGGHDGGMDQNLGYEPFAGDQPVKKKGKKGKKNKKDTGLGVQETDNQGAFDQAIGDQPYQNGPAPYDGNPFQPESRFNQPGAFERPPGMEAHDPRFSARNFLPDHHLSHSQSRSRSRSRRRDAEAEEARRERDRLERKVESLQDNIRLTERLHTNEKAMNEKLNEVIHKVDNWKPFPSQQRPDSSSSDHSLRDRDRDGFWSSPSPSGGSFTPPSSPPLSAVLEISGAPRGRRKVYHPPPRQDPRGYRSKRYQDDRALIEPHSSGQQRRVDYRDRDERRRSGSLGRAFPPVVPGVRHYYSHRRDQRPVLLHHARTYNNDYPSAPVADFPAGAEAFGGYGHLEGEREFDRRRARRGEMFEESRGRSRRGESVWV
ncbi:Hypothetical predicted protein [Lecanosticta acicola]|uniref:Uncharacterized protein n=1 Tax=Lecanosticta acicola TaxID=111012 RepID=A0AAI8YRV8_9PEZI|nr:Hypothetical predicted protein [Lecanosticta acicola]